MPTPADHAPLDAAALDAAALACWSSRWHLAVVAGPDPGWCHAVGVRPTTVGRAPSCTVVLAEPEASRRHLAVRERDGGVQVRDLHSSNGTRWRRPGRRRWQRVGRRWRPVPCGAQLLVARTCLQVRLRPGLSGPPDPGLPAEPTEAQGRAGAGGAGTGVGAAGPAGAAAGTDRLRRPPAGARTHGASGAGRLSSGAGPPAPGRRAAAPVLLSVAWLFPLLLTSGLSTVHRVLVLGPVLFLAATTIVSAVRRPGTGTRAGTGAVSRAAARWQRYPRGSRDAHEPRPGGRQRGQPPPATDPGTSADDPASVLLGAVAARPAGPAASMLHVTGDDRVDVLTEGPLALVGAASAVRAAARWVICRLAAGTAPLPDTVVVDCAATSAWTWLGELRAARPARPGRPGRSTGSDRAPTGGPVDATVDARVGEPVGPVDRAPLVVQDLLGPAGAADDPPSQTGERGRARAPGRTTVVLARSLADVPSWCRRVVDVPEGDPYLVSEAWARQVARAVRRSRAAKAGAALPADVPLRRLLADPMTAWAHPDGSLSAAFAVGADGPRPVDLVRDGPHALVAGTTGSGKSELLLGWVLALACRYPPSALTIVAIDHKGGATFGAVTELPHVAGVHTDLDPAGTARALTGLRAELTRREHVLAAAGARDLDDLARRGTAAVPRLLVVVDEFRVLADQHPELMAGLVRLAAQGRSLGMHLVLATQRPGGAVGPDLRANIRLTVCLRVVGTSDSLDVLGTAAAARLPAVPGRALLATDRTEQVQAAWCGPEGDGVVPGIVSRTRDAAAVLGERPATPLWPPPLPADVRPADLRPADVRADCPPAGTRDGGGRPTTEAGLGPSGLPLLLTEGPEDLRRERWDWPARTSGIVIAGAPGSGRSTALQTLALGALGQGLAVHAVGGLPLPAGHPCLGTVVGTADPRRLGRLLDILADGSGPRLLCLDDIDAVLAALADRSGPELLDRLVRSRACGLALAVAGPVSVLAARWAAATRHRLVLGPVDPALAAVAAIPRSLVHDAGPPGRGVLLGDGSPRLAQVIRHGPGDTAAPAAGATAAGATAKPPPVRLRPIPRRVVATELPAARPHAIPVGIGGDDADVVWVPVGEGARVLVAGPPESGRSTAVAWLADRLRALGRPVLVVGRATNAREITNAAPGAAVLVDDADDLDSAVADAVAARWTGHDGVLVGAVRTDALASYRPPTAVLRQARTVLLLAPLRGGTGHVPAAEVLPHADPAAPRAPGRGVLVEPRRTVAVQLAATRPVAG